MRLVHGSLENPIIPEEITCGILVVERPDLLYRMVKELLTQVEEDDGPFVLSKNMKPLKFSRYLHPIYSFPILDHNPRRVLTALYKQLNEFVIESNDIDHLQSLLDQLTIELKRLAPESQSELEEIESPAWFDVFKFFNLRFKSNFENSTEALSDYFQVMKKYCGYHFFVLLNALGFIDVEGFQFLLRQANYEEFKLLFIEDQEKEEFTEACPRTLIIDRDLCEIVINHV